MAPSGDGLDSPIVGDDLVELPRRLKHDRHASVERMVVVVGMEEEERYWGSGEVAAEERRMWRWRRWGSIVQHPPRAPSWHAVHPFMMRGYSPIKMITWRLRGGYVAVTWPFAPS